MKRKKCDVYMLGFDYIMNVIAHVHKKCIYAFLQKRIMDRFTRSQTYLALTRWPAGQYRHSHMTFTSNSSSMP